MRNKISLEQEMRNSYLDYAMAVMRRLAIRSSEPASRSNTISNGMPEHAGGDIAVDSGGESIGADGAPAVSGDDDGGDSDGEPARSRPKKSFTPSFAPALLGFAPLSHYVQFGRSRIYQLIQAGEFPPPLKIGSSSRWVRAEVDQWLSSRVAARQQQQTAR